MFLPLLSLYLVTATVGLSVACLITMYAPQLSTWIPALTVYGKVAIGVTEQSKVMKLLEVPKRWFTHFYIVAVLNTLTWLLIACLLAFGINPLTTWVYLLQLLTSNSPSISWTTSVAGLLLIFLHVSRRCYESLFVSIYSNSSMNLLHYIMGVVHYLILPLTVVCEAHGFMDSQTESFSLFTLTLRQWIGICLFVYCMYEQHDIAKKMAKTRMSKDGTTSHTKHGIFYGGWFDVVSCPHFFFEVGIYVGLWLVLLNAQVYMFMLAFVAINQTFSAISNHQWYKKTFPDYPKERKAIFPHIL